MSPAAARKFLTGIWWVWSAALIVALATIAISPAMRVNFFGLFGWLFPNILPTLTLVSTAGPAIQAASPGEDASRLIKTAIAASILYFCFLSGFVAASALAAEPLAMLQQANMLLGPLQALAAVTLGLHFGQAAKKP